MIAVEDKCIEGIERRGKVYYMRWRVPARYAAVEKRKEINRSLKTRDIIEAKANLAVAQRSLLADWDFRLKEARGETTPETFDAALEMLREIGVPYRPQKELLADPIEKLLARIEALEKTDTQSAMVPAVLGALDYPPVNFSEMVSIIEETNKANLAGKNGRQLDEWRNKYKHAAKSFCEIVGDKPVLEITEQDAMKYKRHWLTRRDSGEISTNHADKRLRFARQLVDAFYNRFDMPNSERKNPFKELKIEKTASEDNTPKKLSLPVTWIKHHLIDQNGLEGLNEQARDIATISAECGCRQSEIFDLPPDAIHLDHEFPHIQLAPESSGKYKRQIKNAASKRPVMLHGAALEAMKRHPKGFDRYRGKKTYPGTVNNYLKDRKLFPEVADGMAGKYTLSCTRHTFEDRMTKAKMTNEERAYLMGHSVGAVRGRPVYGSMPDLELRALYQEMVAFPTASWSPRSIQTLRAEIDRLAEEQGFRVS
ncbi:hypothetical protein HCZ23_12940 [Celeribacter sp. HF31]|uniref:DUF6538 domain-containing protein n=1 Tax=Celeribacter sp. HF31 TaxID=2721558 RepID=UPI0014300F66|nr:DUF6538 domain-containing protein [Celeribacter sp. HF31]NIY80371.1 hypothetical protein [Celeribacter sp. HF31]